MSPVAFIIGAGSNVGTSVAQHFLKEGYKVAIGSRNLDISKSREAGFYPVKVDVTDQAAIAAAFESVNKELGPANVVVYNVGNHVPLPVAGDSLSIPVADWHLSAQSSTNFFLVAKYAAEGFRKLSSGPKVVIATGNVTPWLPPSRDYAAIQIQKKVIAALVEDFASRYDKERFRFYIASQVTPDHYPVDDLSGPAHATAYWRLVHSPEQLQWEQRFVADGSALNVKH